MYAEQENLFRRHQFPTSTLKFSTDVDELAALKRELLIFGSE